MKCLKKGLSAILGVLLILQSGLFAVTAEEKHWAQDDADALIQKDVISGDGGGLRLDDQITRAEFAKVINRNFAFSMMDTINFPDVPEDAWYYNEMLIARKAGYLTGDDAGMAFPDNPLSRAEACVVLARVIRLSPSADSALSFTDAQSIPEWAASYIRALSDTELMKGYEDGSFLPANHMTRGEVFSVIVRANRYLNPEKPAATFAPETIFNPTSGGTSGGSSGGGGSSGSPKKLSTPVIKKAEGTVLFWGAVKNAASYQAVLTRTTEGKESSQTIESIRETQFDFLKTIQKMTETDKMPLETFLVQVIAVAGSGYQDSAASQVEEMHVTNETIAIPQDIHIAQYFDEQNREILEIAWSAVENAGKYEVSLLRGEETIPLAVSGTTAAFPEGYAFENTAVISFRTLSSDPEIMDSMVLKKTLNIPLFAGGDGEESPYLIRNERHFYNISAQPSGNYQIINDIILEKYRQIESFSGVLSGNKNGEAAIITFHADTSDANQALFGTVSGTIENIGLEGSFTAGTNSAPLVRNAMGTASKKAKIVNCFNNMTVNVLSGARGSALISEAQYAQITGCYNLSDTVTINASFGGGIISVLNNQAELKNCYNTGNITFRQNCSGGVVGAAFGEVSSLYNSGDITQSGTGITGGTIGQLRQYNKNFSSAFNTGKVTGQGIAGGIIGQIYPNTGGVTKLNELYNIGDIASVGGKGGPIYGEWLKTQGTVEFEPDVYVLDGCSYSIETPEAAVITAPALKKVTFKSGVWKKESGSSYPFPQLTAAPYIGDYVYAAPKLPAPSLSIAEENHSFQVTVSGSADTVQYRLEVWKGNSMLKTYVSSNGGSKAVIDITDSVTEYGEYLVKAVAAGNQEDFLDSEAQQQTFTYSSLEPLTAPVLSLEWKQTEEAEIYEIFWDAVADASGYQITVKQDASIVDEVEKTTETCYSLKEKAGLVFGADFTVQVTALASNPEQNSAPGQRTVSTRFAGTNGEDGTEGNPFIIRNYRHFANMAAANDNKYYSVEGDIALPSDYTPITAFSAKLSGKIDENGTLPVIDFGARNGLSNFALIKAMNSGAKVSNLKFTGNLSGSTYISSVANDLNFDAVIDGCESAVVIQATGNYVGGIVSRVIKGTVSNCVNSGDVKTTGQYAGGITAIIWGSSAVQTKHITGCHNTAAVQGGRYTGGICGMFNQQNAVIEKCYNAGSVISTADNVGGIAGAGYGAIRECYNAGAVTGTSNVGGIGGNLCSLSNAVTYAGSIENCYNIGAVTATNGHAGGIVCTIRYNTVTNVYNIGTVTGKNRSPVYRLRYPSGGSAMTGEDQNTVINAYHDEKVTDAYEDTILKSLDELKNPGIFDRADGASGSDLWQIAEDEFGYPYLQLKNNPHKVVFQ